jgi:hypothetical protein
MEVFEYENRMSWEENFSRWKRMNNKERETYKEKLMSEEKAVTTFGRMYPKRYFVTNILGHGKN